MIELYLNEKKVVLASNQKIKLKLENVYFTKSSTYSYDIKLPLLHSDNIAVFGHLERLDVSKKIIKYDAKLVVAGRTILNGSATILDISNGNINIQVLTGNSELNCFFSETFIDSLELGSADIRPDSDIYYPDMDNESANKYWGAYGVNNKYVYFPILNANNDVFRNRVVSGISSDNRQYIRFSLVAIDGVNIVRTGNHAVQPYLCFIIEKICDAIGYKLILNEMEQTRLSQIFIANDVKTYEFAKTLPHWSVTQFFQEIENLFGVITVVNEFDKSVKIKFANTFFNAQEYIKLENVSDNFTNEYDEENNITYSNSNITYNLPSTDYYNAYRKIDDDIINKATIRKYSDYNAMVAGYETLTDIEKKQSILEPQTTLRHYIQIDGILTECNYFRTVWQNDSTEIDIESNIIPAEMIVATGSSLRASGFVDFFGDVAALRGQEIDLSSDEFSIQDAIDGSWSENKTVRDKLPIAMNSGYFQHIHSNTDESRYNIYPWPYISAENLVPPRYTFVFGLELYSLIRDHSFSINTKVKYKINFLTDELPDPTAVFLINNKKYVCESIEVEISDAGIDRMKLGEFYEVV